MKSILHKDFQYTSSVKTDVRKTFARIRREMAEQKKASEAVNEKLLGTVRRIGAK